MSYQVLARKWRPATFEQVVGQSHVLHALTNALSQQRLHHAYLFTGTRGVGKTTLARLFAKGLNCEQGITAHPCGKCDSCVEIAEGRFVDLIEVDAASKTKVDDTRELLENVQYRPSRGRFKVYIIDEVHMLSRSSFNALLKTLEEPPEHVKFLLATTDPQKLPVTVLSRCLQFNLKSLSLEDISGQLEHILTLEKLPFDNNALRLIAKSANGSMRDALSLTDQAIAFGAGKVLLEQVQAMLGSIDDQQVINLLESLIEGDVSQLMEVISQILSFGADADEVLRSLLELLHQITLTQFVSAVAQLSDYSEKVTHFAKTLLPDQVQLYYQILLTGRKDLPFAPDPKSGLEMALLRAVAFIPEPPINHWNTDIDNQSPNNRIMTDNIVGSHKNNSGNVSKDKVSRDNVSRDKVSSDNVSRDNVSSDKVSKDKVCHDDLEPMDISVNRDQVLQEKKRNLVAKKQTVNSTDEHQRSDPINELLVEQSLIMSQAHSMGYEDKENKDYFTDNTDDYVFSNLDSDFNLSSSSETGLIQENAINDNISQQIDQINSLPQASVNIQQAMEDKKKVVSEDDDILNAVLASRASLMSLLNEDISGSELTHNSDITPETKIKKTQPKTALEYEHIPIEPHSDEDKQIDVSIMPQGSTEYVSASSVQHLSPYEAPHEDIIASHQPANLGTDDGDCPPWEISDDVNDEHHITKIADGNDDLHTHPQIIDDTNHIDKTETTSLSYQPLTQKNADIGIVGDPLDLNWYRQISSLNVGGRIRQLAVNSVCLQWSKERVVLRLKPDQKHLASESAVMQLQNSLLQIIDENMNIEIQVGTVQHRETPREVKQRFRQELRMGAQSLLNNDLNVRWLNEFMGAELEIDSVGYPPELLSMRSQQIQVLNAK